MKRFEFIHITATSQDDLEAQINKKIDRSKNIVHVENLGSGKNEDYYRILVDNLLGFR